MSTVYKRTEILPLVAFCGSDSTITVQSHDRKNKFTMPLPAGRVRLKDYIDMVEPSELVLFEGNLRVTSPRRGVVQQSFHEGHYNTSATPFKARSSTDQQIEVLSAQVQALAGVVGNERKKARKTAAERDRLKEERQAERQAQREAERQAQRDAEKKAEQESEDAARAAEEAEEEEAAQAAK